MGDTFLVSGLRKLRAERLGDMQAVREKMEELEAVAVRLETLLGHIEGVLKEVAPGEAIEEIKPVRTNKSRGHAPTGPKSRRDGIGGKPVPKDAEPQSALSGPGGTVSGLVWEFGSHLFSDCLIAFSQEL